MPGEIYARKRSKKERNNGRFFFFVGLILLFVGLPLGGPFIGFILALIPWVISAQYFSYSNIWHLGAAGEEKVAQVLESLGNSYHVIHDFRLPGQRGNFDHIVMGPNGIFLIETKNHKGTIKCNGDEWRQEKVGQLGTIYDGVLRNPSLQVKGNAALFSDFIKQRLKKNIWVNPIIVFTNEEAELYLNDPTVPVFRPEKLCEFIRNHQPGKHLTNQELEEMKNRLNFDF